MRVGVLKGRIRHNHPRSEGCWGSRTPTKRGAYQTHTVQPVKSDEGLRGASIEEGRASLRCNGFASALYCDFGSERNVVQRHSTPVEAGAVFWQRTASEGIGKTS